MTLKKGKPPGEYPLIFHDILREGGGFIPEDAVQWTFLSFRNHWFAFVKACRESVSLQLRMAAADRQWTVKHVSGGIEVSSRLTAAGLAKEIAKS